ncbi:MAG: family 10 glycosylhydrolase [Muribaculaceae bacterium]
MKQISRLLLLTVAIILGVSTAMAADAPVKREMRSTWLATVWRLDWPSATIGGGGTVASQKAEMITLLDSLQANNFNCVNFQVRGRADAFYKSSYEPWSEDLVSKRGNDPGYDPLAFVVEECHKRGMECHAWLNPYRYESVKGQWNNLPGCYRSTHPEWLIDQGGMSIFNPALQEVTDLICNIIREIITNYDVDGILFDDYFYLQGTTTQDDEQYNAYTAAGGTLGKSDWRRQNVNNMVKSVYNTIQDVKPWVRFGISPAGIACTSAGVASKYGLSSYCPTGSDWQYDGIYSEPVQWLMDHSIDYISPQIYWTIGHTTDYDAATKWWSQTAAHFNRHLYVSHSISSLTSSSKGAEALSRNEQTILASKAPKSSGPNASAFFEYANEVRLNREYSLDGCPGSIFYSTKYVYKTAPLFGHYLKTQVFNSKALLPTMTYKPGNNPGIVSNVELNGNELTWDGYDNVRYTVYAIPTIVDIANFDKEAEYLLGMSYDTSFTIPDNKMAGYNYAVCVLDRVGNEYSAAFAGLATEPLDAPTLITPAANESIEAPFIFKWNAVANATIYTVEVAYDNEFKKMVATGQTTGTTLATDVFELLPVDTQLYWRVRASANGYVDGVSAVNPFKSIMVHVTSPADGSVNMTFTPTITWSPADRKVTLEISSTLDFEKIVYSKEVSSGSHTVEKYVLGSNTKYFVRFNYTKDGMQVFSPVISFTTKVADPVATTLAFPTEGGDIYGDNYVIVNKVEGADKVVFEVAKSKSFPSRSKVTYIGTTGQWESAFISTWTQSTTFWSAGTTYYFRALVQYKDATGNTVKSGYSPIVSAIYRGAEGAAEVVEADSFTIDGNTLCLGGVKADVTVYNVAGQAVMSATSDSELSLAPLASGIYLIKINAADKSATLKHVVK